MGLLSALASVVGCKWFSTGADKPGSDTSQPVLADTPVNETPSGEVNGRFYLLHSASVQYNLPVLVGHVLYIPQQDGTCPTIANREYSTAQLSEDTYL